MRYRISEIRISPKAYADREHLMDHLRRALLQQLHRKYRRKKDSGKTGKSAIRVSEIEIIRESIDARKKPDVKAVYTLDFDCPEKLPLPEGGREEYHPPVIEDLEALRAAGSDMLPRPVIAGFGPCGIFAALILAEAGLKPIVIERGRAVDDRMRDVQRFWEEGILDPESNVQFGEGGAGTFSDGKLTTGIRDVRIRAVLQTFVSAGADPAILYQQKPHIGTDCLREIIPRIRRRIEEAGGQIRFETRLTGIFCEMGELKRIQVRSRDGAEEEIDAAHLVLAIGHSARDTFHMLRDQGLPMEQKAFSIGVRIEHPQKQVDAAQYGDPALAEYFGPAVYKLHYRCESGRGVYTFCMCPGGKVINAASETDGFVTNGMSESRRDSGTANSGLLVDVRPEDFGSGDPLAGIEFQRRFERLAKQNGRGFAGGLPQTKYAAFRDSDKDPVRGSLPAFAVESILEAMPHLGRKMAGFDDDGAVMTAVETRSSSPVRILRNEQMESAVRGLIPAGEGPGYAGGIMSAAVDGIRAAEQIISQFTEKQKVNGKIR